MRLTTFFCDVHLKRFYCTNKAPFPFIINLLVFGALKYGHISVSIQITKETMYSTSIGNRYGIDYLLILYAVARQKLLVVLHLVGTSLVTLFIWMICIIIAISDINLTPPNLLNIPPKKNYEIFLWISTYFNNLLLPPKLPISGELLTPLYLLDPPKVRDGRVWGMGMNQKVILLYLIIIQDHIWIDLWARTSLIYELSIRLPLKK